MQVTGSCWRAWCLTPRRRGVPCQAGRRRTSTTRPATKPIASQYKSHIHLFTNPSHRSPSPSPRTDSTDACRHRIFWADFGVGFHILSITRSFIVVPCSTLWTDKNVAALLWPWLWKILMDFNNFYISGNRNECPLQVSFLLIYFICDVSMTSLYVSHYAWCSRCISTL